MKRWAQLQAGRMSLEEASKAMDDITMPGVSASQPPGNSPEKSPLALPGPPPIGNGATPPQPAAEPLSATHFLQVEGMVTAEVLSDDEEYAEVRFLLPFKTIVGISIVVCSSTS